MSPTSRNIADTADEMIERTESATRDVVAKSAAKADDLLSDTQRATAETEKTIQAGLHQLREAVPATLSRAATQAEDLARAGIEKARAAGDSVRQQAQRAGEHTVSYVRDEPAKALLMAVAAGAVATLLIGWATRPRTRQRH